MPGGKVYDPLIGQLMGPAWEDIPSKLSKPTHFNLYRFNGNDPINLRKQTRHLTGKIHGLVSVEHDKFINPFLPRISISTSILGGIR